MKSAVLCLPAAGVPSGPTGPLIVTDVRKNSAVLHWKSPENDGGRPIMLVFFRRHVISS